MAEGFLDHIMSQLEDRYIMLVSSDFAYTVLAHGTAQL